ncbi:tripartite tricarboxylate transporter substrate binding protein [Roseomonas hellenica]|uniref:Tripartite tricarboxylate transporter substrate binding protein n=1 Tax=Plastoroseomonas hellenica TaxID=2687306 RepID=A0ABS5F0G9_9PROT|nr:tripartite tricarboxylate transporter substrate binding protein [Plastoroseomonas hellenica]MBR0666037.1 tripartite tricarboxylate transporter substrate binding protein [Plastoroseomonas hellenica]
MPTRRDLIFSIAVVAALAASGRSASAQSFPNRPLRLVVPYPPGGNVDFTARLLAPVMSQVLGQPVVVDNRTGAGGILGTEAVARARSDGNTLLLGSTGPLSIFPAAIPRLPYDVLRDLAPIGIAYRVPIVLMVSRQLAVQSLAEFVARAKAEPRRFSAGTSGIGSGAHLAMELFNAGSGAGLVHVPYRGTGPALSDLIAGTIPVVFDQLSSALPLHADGRAFILGIASANRSPLLPEVPTLREVGLVEPELTTTLGLLAPAGTPPGALETLRAALVAAVADPAIRQRLGELGAEIAPAAEITPARYAAVIREETETSRRAVALGGIRLE